MRLEGKVAAITGAASGFGAAAAKLFTQHGARVVLGDIQQARGQAVAAGLGDSARFETCDVTVEDDIANLVDTAVREFGQLDIMFNNAGIIGTVGPIATTPADEWKFTVDILLNGVFYGCKHAARVMTPQGRGSIISMASTAGIQGGLGPHCYTACKHAVVGLTKGVAAELCEHNIRVNCIAPAGMATEMIAGMAGDPDDLETARQRIAQGSPLKGRPGLPEDVANAALFLASDESGYTTGHCLTTDAGTTTGSSTRAVAFAEYQPLFREAGKKGI